MRSATANLRSLLSGAFFIAYGLVALPFAALLLIPVWSPEAARLVVRLLYRLFVLTSRWTGLYRVEVDAATRASLADCHGQVVVLNHVSLIDICILFALLPDATALAKIETTRNPFLGAFVRRALIPNDGDSERVLGRARRALAEGTSVVVFPEGTRVRPNAMPSRLHRGAARMALAAQCPIRVFRIDYDPLVLAKGQPWWDVGSRTIRIRVAYRGMLTPLPENNHRNSCVLTDSIRTLMECPS